MRELYIHTPVYTRRAREDARQCNQCNGQLNRISQSTNNTLFFIYTLKTVKNINQRLSKLRRLENGWDSITTTDTRRKAQPAGQLSSRSLALTPTLL